MELFHLCFGLYGFKYTCRGGNVDAVLCDLCVKRSTETDKNTYTLAISAKLSDGKWLKQQ